MQGAGGASAQHRPLTPIPPRAWAVPLLAIAAVFSLSEAVASRVAGGGDRVLVPAVLSLTVTHNRGVAFGLLARLPSPVPIAVALTVLAVVFYNGRAWLTSGAGRWGLGLLVGGALRNVWERVHTGYVLDYLDVHVWPVFNLADIAIVVGAGLLVIALQAGSPNGARAARKPPDRRSAEPGGDR